MLDVLVFLQDGVVIVLQLVHSPSVLLLQFSFQLLQFLLFLELFCLPEMLEFIFECLQFLPLFLLALFNKFVHFDLVLGLLLLDFGYFLVMLGLYL